MVAQISTQSKKKIEKKEVFSFWYFKIEFVFSQQMLCCCLFFKNTSIQLKAYVFSRLTHENSF